MYEQYLAEAKQEMAKALVYLNHEFSKLRVGKANPALLEDVLVDYYGTRTPLKQLATINVSDVRVLIIQPYDRGSLKAMESAINQANLGLSCSGEKDLIRVIFPEINEERRKELVKILSQKAEEAKIIIRNAREKSWKEIKTLAGEGKVTEDEKYKAQAELDKMAGETNEAIKEQEEKKAQEIMTV